MGEQKCIPAPQATLYELTTYYVCLYVFHLVERIHARNQTNCAFCDKSMKLGTWFLDILRSILGNGAISDLIFGDL